MPEYTTLDPEVEAVLREVAADQHSALLRVPRDTVRPTLLDEPTRDRQLKGLSSAEKQLLTVHRGELAWLLRQMCLSQLFAKSPAKLVVSRYKSISEKCKVWDQSQLADRVRSETIFGNHSPNHGAIELLSRSLRLASGQSPSISELIAVAMSLEPTNQARLIAAIDLALRGNQYSAIRVARSVLNKNPAQEHAVRAWECIGFALSKLARYTQAYKAYDRACAIGNQYLEARMNRFLFALQAGARKEALDSAADLDTAVNVEQPNVKWFLSVTKERQSQGEWTPTEGGKRLGSTIATDLNEVAKRIADVVQ